MTDWSYDPDEAEPFEDCEESRLKTLWSSVLRLAVMDWVTCSGKHSIRKRSVWRDAHNWLFSDDRTIADDEGVTFPAVCSVLDLEPEWVRKQVTGLTEEDVRANRPDRRSASR